MLQEKYFIHSKLVFNDFFCFVFFLTHSNEIKSYNNYPRQCRIPQPVRMQCTWRIKQNIPYYIEPTSNLLVTLLKYMQTQLKKLKTDVDRYIYIHLGEACSRAPCNYSEARPVFILGKKTGKNMPFICRILYYIQFYVMRWGVCL